MSDTSGDEPLAGSCHQCFHTCETLCFGTWGGEDRGCCQRRVHHGAALQQGNSCTLAGPAWMSFCLVFLKSGAKGMPGQGCPGQPPRRGPGAAGFCCQSWCQRWSGHEEAAGPGNTPSRSRQHPPPLGSLDRAACCPSLQLGAQLAALLKTRNRRARSDTLSSGRSLPVLG